MKMNKILLAIVAASVFVASCNTSLTVQKRQHSNGYYVSVSSTDKKAQKVENTVVVKKENSSLSAREVAVANAETKVVEVKALVANQAAVASVENKNVAPKSVSINNEVKSALGKKATQSKATEQTMKVLQAPAKKSRGIVDDHAILLIILAIFLPFAAVGIVTAWDLNDVLINVILTLLCGIPGIIHAFYILNREGVI